MLKQPTYQDQQTMDAELEKLAEAFEAREFHLASLCMTKILHALIPHDPEVDEDMQARARRTDVHAEAHKAIDAIDTSNFSLAALCLRKVLGGSTLPDRVTGAGEELVRALEIEDFTGAASYVRSIRDEVAPIVRLDSVFAMEKDLVGEPVSAPAERVTRAAEPSPRTAWPEPHQRW